MTNAANDMWADAEIISSYTREQAIEDGVLISIPTDLVKEAGLRLPFAMTADAWEAVVALTKRDEEMGQDITGRLWDVLTMFRFFSNAARGRATSDRVRFKVSVRHGRRNRVHLLTAICGPGDNAEPVMTIKLAA